MIFPEGGRREEDDKRKRGARSKAGAHSNLNILLTETALTQEHTM